jgi:hypothetical protein
MKHEDNRREWARIRGKIKQKKRCYRLFDNLIPSILDHLALDFNEPVALPHA